MRCYYPYKLQAFFKLKNSHSFVARWVAGLPAGSVKDSDEETQTTDQENVLFSSPSSSATQTPSPSTSATLTPSLSTTTTLTVKPDQGQAQASTSKIEQDEVPKSYQFRFLPRQPKREPFERSQTVPPNLYLAPTNPTTTSAQIHISHQPLSTTLPVQRRAASIPPMASASVESPPKYPDQMTTILEEVELDELPPKLRSPTQEEKALGYPRETVLDDMTHKEWLSKARRKRDRASSSQETKFGFW